MSLAALYRDIVETSPDGIWVFDLEGRTIYANPRIAQMFGIDESELGDLTVFDTLDAQGRRPVRRRTWTAVRRGHVNSDEVEVQFVRRDGSAMWVLVRESTLMAPDGSGTAVLHRVSDYGDRRLIVESLRTSERRLAEAQRIARIGSWEWDSSTTGSPAPRSSASSSGSARTSFPSAYSGFLELRAPGRPGRPSTPRSGLPCTTRRGSSSPPASGAATSGCGPAAAASRCGTRPAGSSACPGRTRTSARPSRPRSPCRTRSRRTCSCRRWPRGERGPHARGPARPGGSSLVLLHDDWERARAFAPDGRRPGRRAPLHPRRGPGRGRTATAPGPMPSSQLANRAFHERRLGVGRRRGSPSPSRSRTPTRSARSSRSGPHRRCTATT